MSKELIGEAWITSRRKRLFDVAVSGALTPLLAPVAGIGGLAFFLENRINPILVQQRSGRDGLTIPVIKLRSMPYKGDYNDSSNGHEDERASRIGRLLRKTTLDEAPQLLNILSGQMSIVGPRPLIESDISKTLDLLSPEQQRDWELSRATPRPGWLSDFGNASRSIEPQSEEYLLARVEKDIDYLATASYQVDLEIIKGAFAIGKEMINRQANV